MGEGLDKGGMERGHIVVLGIIVPGKENGEPCYRLSWGEGGLVMAEERKDGDLFGKVVAVRCAICVEVGEEVGRERG